MVAALGTNIERIRKVALALAQWKDKSVFLGGSVMELLLTDPAAPPVRPTEDVDIVIGVWSQVEYATRLREELLALGFVQSMQDDVICRWRFDDIIVDIMPPIKDILGFTNKWYDYAMQTAVPFPLDDSLDIRLISSPCFIAVKLEAFKVRGNNDYLMSRDMNDIISVIDGREEVVKEVADSDDEVKGYILNQFEEYLKDDRFEEGVRGFFRPDPVGNGRFHITMARLQQIIKACRSFT